MIKLDITYYDGYNDSLEKNVHTEHCCILHGCKYGDDTCPVWLGYQRQSYRCEACFYDELSREQLIVTVEEINRRRDDAHNMSYSWEHED